MIILNRIPLLSEVSENPVLKLQPLPAVVNSTKTKSLKAGIYVLRFYIHIYSMQVRLVISFHLLLDLSFPWVWETADVTIC